MTFLVSANSDKNISGISGFFNALLACEETYGTRDEFRVSQMPYCPVIDATEDKTHSGDFSMDFYAGVGTAVHELVQKYLGKHAFARGCWQCNYCKNIHGSNPPSEKPYNVKPTKLPKGERCENCRKFPHWKYAEVQFDYKGLSGHMDFLLRYHKKLNIVLDFKTCSNKYIEKEYMARFLPMDKHPHQIETYCALMWLQYGIRIDYYILVYLARDKPYEKNPKKPKNRWGTLVIKQFTDEMLEKRIAKIQKAVKGRKAVKAGDITNIIKYKPCGTRNEYLNGGMDDKWFGKEKCPHFTSGVCFHSKKLGKFLRKNVK